jgi:hypothetical protein
VSYSEGLGAVYGKVVEIVEWGGDPEAGASRGVLRGVSWGMRSRLACGERTARLLRMVIAAKVDGMCT